MYEQRVCLMEKFKFQVCGSSFVSLKFAENFVFPISRGTTTHCCTAEGKETHGQAGRSNESRVGPLEGSARTHRHGDTTIRQPPGRLVVGDVLTAKSKSDSPWANVPKVGIKEHFVSSIIIPVSQKDPARRLRRTRPRSAIVPRQDLLA